jgi:hypothetical protein
VALNTIKPNQINGREKNDETNKYHGKTIEIGRLTVNMFC